jgi:hypothetical protein
MMLRRTSITSPKIFEPVRYQRRVVGGADDRPIAKSSLDRPGAGMGPLILLLPLPHTEPNWPAEGLNTSGEAYFPRLGE